METKNEIGGVSPTDLNKRNIEAREPINETADSDIFGKNAEPKSNPETASYINKFAKMLNALPLERSDRIAQVAEDLKKGKLSVSDQNLARAFIDALLSDLQ